MEEPGKNRYLFPPSTFKARENTPVVFRKLVAKTFLRTFNSNILEFTTGCRGIPMSHQLQQNELELQQDELQLSNRGIEINFHNKKKKSNWQHFCQFQASQSCLAAHRQIEELLQTRGLVCAWFILKWAQNACPAWISKPNALRISGCLCCIALIAHI